MHEFGTNHPNTIDSINMINNLLEELCESLDDSIVIITADHGHINSTYVTLTEYPNLFNCLKRTTSIDSRASMFFIKEEMHQKFEKIFKFYFGKCFVLLNKQQIIDYQLFGTGTNHSRFESCLGDYIAIAISDKNIKYQPNNSNLVSNHAGNTEDETIIPLIVINKN